MKKNKCLIITHGFFGDIIFASSIADKLKNENKFQTVDYLIGFPQIQRLLQNNPYIDNVYISDNPSPIPVNLSINYNNYDSVIKLQQLSFLIPPPVEYQKYCGITSPNPEYTVYTEHDYDVIAKNYIGDISKNGKKTIAIMTNWKSKTYLFTEDEYKKGIDVPHFGYGGKNRDIEFIEKNLSEYFNIIYVGMNNGISQQQTSIVEDHNEKSILFESSIMKYCDAFVGTEGGLCNIAAGVGTKTIITGDFVHQLYGWNGVIKKIKEPMLGPKYYFKNKYHTTLNPYYSDDEVLSNIISILQNGY